VASKTPGAGAFIGGLISGLAVGAVVGMPVAVLVSMWLLRGFPAGASYAFAATYSIGVGLGIWALLKTRARADFAAGMLTGLAAGLLGSTALCNTIVGNLGTMH
jgi:hypothetical protein